MIACQQNMLFAMRDLVIDVCPGYSKYARASIRLLAMTDVAIAMHQGSCMFGAVRRIVIVYEVGGIV